jgi:hypothetical protein
MSRNLVEQIQLSEPELYNNIINKIDEMKNRIIDIKSYVENSNDDINIHLKYLEKFNLFSFELNNLNSIVNDMFDEFILKMNPSELNNNDKNRLKNLMIEKKIQNIFTPYMLYLQILLQNTEN